MFLCRSFRQTIKVTWQNFTSFVDVDIYGRDQILTIDGSPLVIVMKDPGVDGDKDNPFGSGISVTNAVGAYAFAIAKHLRLDEETLKNVIWVEHYPARDARRKGLREKPTYDVVTFCHEDLLQCRFCGPNWRHMTEDQFKEMINGQHPL